MKPMRVLPLLFFFIATVAPTQADPPEIDSTSPDQAWTITARWVKNGAVGEGYDWDVKSAKTGKVYFHEDVRKDEALPHRFDVQWSSDSHYAALDIYYGRVVQGAMVIQLNVANPQLIDPTRSDFKKPMEKTLLRSEDLALYTGSARLLTGADRWINNTDLSVLLEMHTWLEDKKTGEKYLLNTTWHKTVRFKGKSCRVIESVCDSYDKKPDAN
jgi:hypothetical protein